MAKNSLNKDEAIAIGMVQEDGKIVVGGTKHNFTTRNSYFLLSRFNEEGIIDSTFGENGNMFTNIGEEEYATSILLQNDGKIILAGSNKSFIDKETSPNFAMARYLNDEALPLHFTYFNTFLTANGGIVLNWQTAQENNNDYFTVERSENSHFAVNEMNEITRINSKGSSSQAQTYSYSDNTPLQGTNFYRLKQVDKDGKFSYSEIVSATIENGLSVVLYPNPVKDVLNIKGLSSINNYQLKINNAKGNVVASTQINNTLSYKWNLRSLSKGIYYLSVRSNQKTTTVKFLKE